jgi:GABA(A) receptor-associated protein
MSKYQTKFSYTQRKTEADRILQKYPDRIPIICERAKMCRDTAIRDLDKRKYLVPKDLKLADFMYVIRKRMKLSPEKSIFLFLGDNNLAPCSALLGTLYHEYKEKDGFLYITYNGESTFG